MMKRRPELVADNLLVPCCEQLESRRMLAMFQASDFVSIQAALDAAAAAPGADIVAIGRGTFTENLTIQDNGGLTLRGIPGRNGTKLDGGSGIGINIVNSTAVEIRNLAVVAGNEGIVVDGTGDLTLKNVTVANQLADGVRVESVDTMTIDRGTYESNATKGILIKDANVVTAKNVSVFGNGHDGFSVLPVASQADIFVLGGRFDGNGDDGLDLKGNNITISRASASANAEDGIQVSQVTSATLVNVKSMLNMDEGIDLDQINTLEITNAMAKDNGVVIEKDGLDVRNVTTLTITRGLFSGNTGNGLDLNEIGSATVSSVRTTGNGKHGLAADLVSNLEIIRGSFTNNTRKGLDLDGTAGQPLASVLIDRVVATGNASSGLEVNFADSLHVSAGRFMNNGGNGIRVESTSQIDVQRANASRNQQDGLIVEGDAATQLTITAGTFSRNQEDGIDVINVGTVFVSRARGMSNQDDGIEVLNAINVDLPGSRFVGNGDDNISII